MARIKKQKLFTIRDVDGKKTNVSAYIPNAFAKPKKKQRKGYIGWQYLDD